jgi:hypothetical protein
LTAGGRAEGRGPRKTCSAIDLTVFIEIEIEIAIEIEIGIAIGIAIGIDTT